MSKYATIRDNLNRDFKHLNRLKNIYRKRYKKRQDPVLLRALRKREIELTLLRKEVARFIDVD